MDQDRTEEAVQRSRTMPEGFDEVKRIGFELFTQGKVRRLAQGIYAIRAVEGSYIAENREGHWKCDCERDQDEKCPHIFAAQLSRVTLHTEYENLDEPFKCRYCGSPDLRGCGFRYNARGIARRYFCNECRRKFSIKYMGQGAIANAPSELLWILNELSAALTHINDVLVEINKKLGVPTL